MNFFALAKRPRPAVTLARKAAPLGYGGGIGNNMPLGNGYTDTYRKDRAPTDQELIAQLVGIAYACVWLNANATAATRIRLYVKTAPGQKKTRWRTAKVTSKMMRHLSRQKTSHVENGVEIEEVKDHPILRLLDVNQSDPSVDDDDYSDDRPALSGFNLRRLTQVFLESVGRAYWLVEKGSLGEPLKVFLLRSHLVKEVFDPSGTGKILYYSYGGPAGVKYAPDQIVRFVEPDPYTIYQGGYSPMMAAIEKLRIYRKQDAHINAVLDNMARPDAIWSPKGDQEGSPIGTAEARRVEVALNQKFREAGSGSILVQPYPGSLQVLGWKPQDVVEIERAKDLKNDIYAVFSVPNVLMDRNASNLASAKTGDFAHAKYAVLPRMTGYLSTLRDLVAMYDDSGRLFFEADPILPDDEVFALEQTRVGATIGAVSVDEIRRSIDLEPYGEGAGDIRYINNELVPIGKDGLPIVPAPDAGGGDGTPLETPPPNPAKVARRLRDAGWSVEEAKGRAARQRAEL